MKNTSVVEAVFSRSRVRPLFTFLWKATPESIRSVISDQIAFSANEKPILSFYRNRDKYWVLTTERVVLNFDSVEDIYLKDIDDVKLDKLFRDDVNKLDIDSVRLEKIDGGYFDLEVEKRTWHVIFKMFKFLLGK